MLDSRVSCNHTHTFFLLVHWEETWNQQADILSSVVFKFQAHLNPKASVCYEPPAAAWPVTSPPQQKSGRFPSAWTCSDLHTKCLACVSRLTPRCYGRPLPKPESTPNLSALKNQCSCPISRPHICFSTTCQHSLAALLYLYLVTSAARVRRVQST